MGGKGANRLLQLEGEGNWGPTVGELAGWTENASGGRGCEVSGGDVPQPVPGCAQGGVFGD